MRAHTIDREMRRSGLPQTGSHFAIQLRQHIRCILKLFLDTAQLLVIVCLPSAVIGTFVHSVDRGVIWHCCVALYTIEHQFG